MGYMGDCAYFTLSDFHSVFVYKISPSIQMVDISITGSYDNIRISSYNSRCDGHQKRFVYHGVADECPLRLVNQDKERESKMNRIYRIELVYPSGQKIYIEKLAYTFYRA